MAAVPLDHVLLLAAALFVLGPAGVLLRRNLVFMLMAIEVMLNAAGLAFVAAGARWGQADGQIMFILVLTLAAADKAERGQPFRTEAAMCGLALAHLEVGVHVRRKILGRRIPLRGPLTGDAEAEADRIDFLTHG